MADNELIKLFERVRAGSITPEEAATEIGGQPGFTDLGYAKVDTDRARRQGMAEVVYGAGKTDGQIVGICQALADSGTKHILVTRIDQPVADKLIAAFQEVRYDPIARLAVVLPEKKAGEGMVLILSAGTSDQPVAEEAALTAEAMGAAVVRVYDAGVSGLHRLLPHMDKLRDANAIVVVAGMDGALASVAGGLTDRPVIAVPTSVGYGASMGGVAALLSMLNSCASGVAVMNIDNGFGGGLLAGRVNRIVVEAQKAAKE